MKKDYVHICVVLDASGSMGHLTESTKRTFCEFIQSQQKEVGKTCFDLFQFESSVKHLVQSADLSQVSAEQLMSDYRCSGTTAMNDAICTAIDHLGNVFAAMPEDERPEKVLVAILTDGEENASREFTVQDVKKRIEHQQKVYSWDFMFLAANQDAVLSGSRLGLQMQDCVNFQATAQGLMAVSDQLYERACMVRGRQVD